MSKVKKYSRQLMVLFLVMATALTCMFAFTPEADASENGNYTIRLKAVVTTYSDHLPNVSVTVNYKTNNGYGSAGSVTFSHSEVYSLVNYANNVTNYSATKSISGFPTSASVSSTIETEGGTKPTTRYFDTTFIVQVLDANGSWVDLGSGTQHANQAGGSNSSKTTSYNVDSSKNPKISSHKFYVDNALATSATVKTGETHLYSVSAYDQYGVRWMSDIASANWDKACTTSSVDAKSMNATFTDTNGGTDYSSNLTVKWNNSTYSASLTANVRVPHSLTIDANGGTYSGTNPVTGKYTNDTASLSNPVRGGYTFSSWSKTAGNGSLSGNTFTFGNNNATIKANWSIVQYSISPVYGDTTYAAVAYNVETTSITLPTPSKTGYTFNGWVVSKADGNWSVGENVTANPAGKYGNITIEPKWTANSYNVVFDDNLFNYLAWKDAGITGSRAEISDITDTGFTVTSLEGNDGYCAFSNPATAVQGSTEYTLAADISYQGTADYDVFVQFLDATGAHIEYRNVHTDTFTFTTPDNCGFIKIRFDANNAGNVLRAENIRLYKTGTGNNGASVESAISVVYDGTYGTLPVPEKAHYDFVGWFTSGNTQLVAGAPVDITSDLHVYSRWTPSVYNITFNTDGGNSISGITYDIEDTSVSLPTPVKTGYTFSHWIVENQDGNWTAGSTVNGTLASNYGNVGLKAVYTPNNYTLNLNLNAPAGAVTEPACEKSAIDVTFDAAVGTLPVPTLDGYTFAGWYNTATGGTQVTASTAYTTADDSTVYATWTPVTYNINTDANGGNDVADGTYTIENGTIPAGGTRTGYTFSHWEVAADSGNWVAGETFNAGSSAAGKYSDVTLNAVWTANDYTASFELNDAEGIGAASVNKNQITVIYDSALNVNEALPVATRNGYTFLGWFTSAEGGEKVTDATVYTTDGNTTYYAQWELIEYTVTLNVNNGNPIDPITYTIEDSLTLPLATRNGYEFTNWFYSSVTTGSWVRNTSFAPDALDLGTGNWGNVEIKANYTVKSFNITWIVNGESEVTSHPFNTYPTHEDPAIENDPCYIYEFTGWDPVVEVVSGDATYTAVFKTTPREYTVSWVADGVTVHSQKVAYGADVPTGAAAVPAKTGHTGEWDYTGVTTMPAEDITIEAVYTPVNYTISWEVEGTVVDTDSVAYGTLPSYTGSTPVKTEDSKYTYEFAGWTPKITVVSSEATYTAVFNSIPKTYTIYWYAEDNSLVTTQDVAYGSAITNIPKVPEKLGSVGSWADVPETMPDHDVMIYPVYVKGSLVTWFLEGTADGASYQQGFENGTQIAYNRSNPTKPADAEYAYTFEGWATDENGNVVIGADNVGYPVASENDFCYYAVFSKIPREYTIEWVADGEVVYSEIIAYGSAVDFIPEVPAKTGHTGKWGTSPATMPAEDVTITAEYTPINYTITWVVGDNSHDTTFAYGTTPSFTGSTARPSTATTDYTFIGWDKEIETVTGDTTYTAQYSESARKYTVTWQYDNGTVIDTFTVANGEAITDVPVIADKEGHTYSYTVPEAMPAEDIVIVVTYEAKDYTITWVTPSGSTETTWKYGTTPVYAGETPVKEATAEKVYTFAGWNPEILVVTGNATYTAQFTESARRYSVVWYVNGEFFDARDIAFGDIIPTLDVPQVPGFNGVWDNPFRTMPAHDVTINAVYNAKKYTVYWKVDGLTVFSASVAYGDAIPSKVVPEKVGCTGEWVNVPDKMPAENITISAVYTANDYTITWRIDGVEHSDTVTYGNEYVLKLESAAIPEEVRVTIDGSLMNAESYHYDVGTGTLTIYGHAITGNIHVTARAAGGNYNIILNITNASLSNSSLIIAEKTVYHTQIIPAAGYLLPSSVDVFVDGMPVDGFTYNPANGKLTINAEVIVGELEIAFDCPPDPDYDPSATPDDAPDSGHCNCSCHSESAFTKFFFDLITLLRKLFGMDEYRYCECGAAHW